jgi:hypothetical protein
MQIFKWCQVRPSDWEEMVGNRFSARSRRALGSLYFRLPLRTIADMEIAEKVLRNSHEQFKGLCQFLHFILKVSEKGYKRFLIQILI